MITLIDVSQLSLKLCKTPIQTQLMYGTWENFLGRIVDGYDANCLDICLMTPKAGAALCQVQNYLNEHEKLGLLIFDAYRPKRAVRDFVRWSQLPPANDCELARKKLHYPHVDKDRLFAEGYVAEDSGHCYGNTVDLVLIDLATHQELPMGAIFDFMDVKSHWSATAEQIGIEALQNRQCLLKAMQKFDFHPYEKEFWHYSHGGQEGREVNVPFDIPITLELRGVGVK